MNYKLFTEQKFKDFPGTDKAFIKPLFALPKPILLETKGDHIDAFGFGKIVIEGIVFIFGGEEDISFVFFSDFMVFLKIETPVLDAGKEV